MKINIREEQTGLFDNEATVSCRRCGCRCRPSVGNPKARVLRRAKKGFCASCAIVDFLQRLDNESGGHLLSGIRPGQTPGLALRLPHVQKQILNILKAGNSDVTPEEIDWDRIIEVW